MRRNMVMTKEEEQVQLKFRIYDGTDIGHGTYPTSTFIDVLRDKLFHEWPQDKSVKPDSADDIRLIHAGRFLEDGRTLAQSMIHIDDILVGVITMHVVVQPGNNGKNASCELVYATPSYADTPRITYKCGKRSFVKYTMFG
ncbi:hypothetical protein ACH5RR_010746 [Cinchona calisaya]|uniref:UBL3-like ubiquitin domain-containing protein n=1 Tax=Cinchona calisaya TaxID=153742 RepID=A0ABD3AJY9_9GENT